MSSQLRMRLLLIVAIVAVIVGISVLVLARSQPASFGWFAYAPLSSTFPIADGVHVVSTTGVIGAVVLVIGLVTLAFWTGLRVGGRRAAGDG